MALYSSWLDSQNPFDSNFPAPFENHCTLCTLSWNSNTLATSSEELTYWKRLWCWEGLGAGGEGDDRGWDGWMASPTRWTWVWANSGSWWWTGRPGVLRFMGSQRVGHDWATELIWFSQIYLIKLLYQNFWFSHYTFPFHLNAIHITSHWFSASVFAISISPDPPTSKQTTCGKTGATENHKEPRREVNTLEQG